MTTALESIKNKIEVYEQAILDAKQRIKGCDGDIVYYKDYIDSQLNKIKGWESKIRQLEMQGS